MFNLTLQHCTPELEERLKAMADFKAAYQTRDTIALLGMLALLNNYVPGKSALTKGGGSEERLAFA